MVEFYYILCLNESSIFGDKNRAHKPISGRRLRHIWLFELNGRPLNVLARLILIQIRPNYEILKLGYFR